MTMRPRAPQYVVGYLFNNDGTEVALIQKDHPAPQVGMLNGIGGKLCSMFESPIDAMGREFREETGGHLSTLSLKYWEPTVTLRGDTWEVFYFKAFSSIQIDLLKRQEVWPTSEPVAIYKVADLPLNLYTHVFWTIHISLTDIAWPVVVYDRTRTTYERNELLCCPFCPMTGFPGEWGFECHGCSSPLDLRKPFPLRLAL